MSLDPSQPPSLLGTHEQVTCRSNSGPAEEQMVKILREPDQTPIAEVAKKHGVSDVTIYAWRKRFGQLESVDVKRLRQLEQENAKLKKLLAERDLEIDVMKEVAAKKCMTRPVFARGFF